MRCIDDLHLKLPFYGSRKMTVTLKAEGRAVNRKRIQRLMRQMGLEALVPKPAQFTAEELIGVLRARSAKIPRLRDALRPPTDDDDDRRRPRCPRWTSPAPLDYI